MNQSKNKPPRKTTIIVGLGKSGIAAARLLHKEGQKVVVIEKAQERKHKEIAKELGKLGIVVALGQPLKISSFQPWLEDLSDVITSPSIPWDHETLNELRDLGIRVQGEISLAWERLKHIPWIGITGTNGKTTVTEMLKHILQRNQINAPAGGNVGNPACEIALNTLTNPDREIDWLIMELSSYQIESASQISPKIGLWTTFSKDHLERHGTLETYFNIKNCLLEKSLTTIYNADDKYLISQQKKLKEGIWVSVNKNPDSNNSIKYWVNNEGMVYEKNQKLFHSSILEIPGSHNIQNLLMVTAAAREIGLSPKAIEYGLKGFKGVTHRLEYLGNINGIKVFNDSKATNYEAATVALKAISGTSVLLAGGKIKEGDASEWIHQLHTKISQIYLFGSAAKELEKKIIQSGFNKNIYIYNDLKEASINAFNMALKINAANILLSPACASFDQYKDFEERGDHFKELFKSFKNRKLNLYSNS